MKQSLVRKAGRIAKAIVPKPRDRYFWWEQDEPREAVQARIRPRSPAERRARTIAS
jgi:hypothetical protein